MSLSCVGFLRRGVSMAFLNLSGKTPSWRERLMILVIGVRTSCHSLMMKVGQGPSHTTWLGTGIGVSLHPLWSMAAKEEVVVGCSLP